MKCAIILLEFQRFDTGTEDTIFNELIFFILVIVIHNLKILVISVLYT